MTFEIELRHNFSFVYSFFIPDSTRLQAPPLLHSSHRLANNRTAWRCQLLCVRCHAVLWLAKFVGRLNRQPVITSMLFFPCQRGWKRCSNIANIVSVFWYSEIDVFNWCLFWKLRCLVLSFWWFVVYWKDSS